MDVNKISNSETFGSTKVVRSTICSHFYNVLEIGKKHGTILLAAVYVKSCNSHSLENNSNTLNSYYNSFYLMMFISFSSLLKVIREMLFQNMTSQ